VIDVDDLGVDDLGVDDLGVDDVIEGRDNWFSSIKNETIKTCTYVLVEQGMLHMYVQLRRVVLPYKEGRSM
jgi:hypothetical protein